MGFQINTNTAANNAYRTLNNTQTNLSKSLEKLSSGLRINRAADDAAGLAISEGLRSQVNGLSVAANNAQDGVNVVQTAEGGLNQTHAILQRLRDLAVQAGNDSNNADSRAAISTEADGLVSELGRIAGSTNFNGINLLDGSKTGATALKFQVGADGNADSQITVDLGAANVTNVTDALSGGGKSFTSIPADASTLNGTQQFSVANPDGSATAVSAAVSGLVAGSSASDIAAALNKDTQFSANMVASVDKNGDLNVKSLNGGVVTAGATNNMGAAVAGPAGGLDFTSASGAQASIAILSTQIEDVSTARASLGASQNRLEYAVQTINVSKENLSASESRIRDTDMASEMVKFTRSNILSQAGTAMLAQANQSGQGVLQLLR